MFKDLLNVCFRYKKHTSEKNNNCLTREDNSDFLWWYPLTNSSQTCEVAQSPAKEAWLQV